MRSLLGAIVIFCTGLAVGWALKSNNTPTVMPESLATQNPPVMSRPEQIKAHHPKDRVATPASADLASDREDISPQNHGPSDDFVSLLKKKQYTEAMDLYQDIEFRDETAAAELKKSLLLILGNDLKSMQLEDFNNTAEAWLSVYYKDIDVLLLLADFNSVQNYYGEAVSIFQLASNYALNDGQHQKVNNAIKVFLATKDRLLAEREDWYTLQTIYEMAEESGVAQAEHMYRLAEIYMLNGSVEESKAQARKLVRHHRLGNKAQALLEQLQSDTDDFVPEGIVQGQVVPLKKLGGHYIADLVFSDELTLKMVLDTGATTTAVSPSAADLIAQVANIEYARPRLFNTANGVVKGDVFVVDKYIFGGYLLQELQIAVLPMELSSQVSGLLGMNILSQFKFHLDQEKSELVLERKIAR